MPPKKQPSTTTAIGDESTVFRWTHENEKKVCLGYIPPFSSALFLDGRKLTPRLAP
jgi:hypothetical protein